MAIKFNRSTTYIYPLLNAYIPLQHFKLLISTYMMYEKYTLGEYIHIQYKYDGSDEDIQFTHYENELMENEYYVDSIDIEVESGIEILFTFKIPDELLEVVSYFINGKYSEFSRDTRDILLSFWREVYGEKAIRKLNQILIKSSILRKELSEFYEEEISEDAELGDIWNEKQELIII